MKLIDNPLGNLGAEDIRLPDYPCRTHIASRSDAYHVRAGISRSITRPSAIETVAAALCLEFHRRGWDECP
jgi:hypothetical protein